MIRKCNVIRVKALEECSTSKCKYHEKKISAMAILVLCLEKVFLNELAQNLTSLLHKLLQVFGNAFSTTTSVFFPLFFFYFLLSLSFIFVIFVLLCSSVSDNECFLFRYKICLTLSEPWTWFVLYQRRSRFKFHRTWNKR